MSKTKDDNLGNQNSEVPQSDEKDITSDTGDGENSVEDDEDGFLGQITSEIEDEQNAHDNNVFDDYGSIHPDGGVEPLPGLSDREEPGFAPLKGNQRPYQKQKLTEYLLKYPGRIIVEKSNGTYYVVSSWNQVPRGLKGYRLNGDQVIGRVVNDWGYSSSVPVDTVQQEIDLDKTLSDPITQGDNEPSSITDTEDDYTPEFNQGSSDDSGYQESSEDDQFQEREEAAYGRIDAEDNDGNERDNTGTSEPWFPTH